MVDLNHGAVKCGTCRYKKDIILARCVEFYYKRM